MPIVGGIAMFLGVTLGIGLAPPSSELGLFLAACTLLVTTGLLDDAFTVSVALATLLATIGLIVSHVGLPEYVSLALFTLMGVFVTFLIYRAAVLLPFIPAVLRRKGLASLSCQPERASAL